MSQYSWRSSTKYMSFEVMVVCKCSICPLSCVWYSIVVTNLTQSYLQNSGKNLEVNSSPWSVSTLDGLSMLAAQRSVNLLEFLVAVVFAGKIALASFKYRLVTTTMYLFLPYGFGKEPNMSMAIKSREPTGGNLCVLLCSLLLRKNLVQNERLFTAVWRTSAMCDQQQFCHILSYICHSPGCSFYEEFWHR